MENIDKVVLGFVSILFHLPNKFQGARGGAVVEALHYKPEGRGIDSRWCHWNFPSS
jgi:hypothetical protein